MTANVRKIADACLVMGYYFEKAGKNLGFFENFPKIPVETIDTAPHVRLNGFEIDGLCFLKQAKGRKNDKGKLGGRVCARGLQLGGYLYYLKHRKKTEPL